MEWPNYQHLLYFWTVARLGSIARASEELLLAPATIHAQIRTLEQQMGAKLFTKQGRSLVLTDAGRVAVRYADGIFALGREMMGEMRLRASDEPPVRLVVGVEEAVPKLVVREIIKPALALGRPVRLICREGSDEALLAELASHQLDMILSDHPPKGGNSTRAVSHLLGECGISFMAAPALAATLAADFPRSLDGAPVLLPTDHTSMRWTLDRWFQTVQVRPRVVAELDDSALMKVFGSDGMGFFAVHSVITDEIGRRYGVVPIGHTAERTERFYAITSQRKIQHDAVVVMAEAARRHLFASA